MCACVHVCVALSLTLHSLRPSLIPSLTPQLSLVLQIIRDVSLRHPSLVHSSLQVAIAMYCEQGKDANVRLCDNLWTIVQRDGNRRDSQIRYMTCISTTSSSSVCDTDSPFKGCSSFER